MIAIDEVRDYVGGEWRRPSSGGGTEVLNPATGEVIGRAPLGAAEDIDATVAAAAAAHPV
jgi:aldehyde dehydrogenase (NAD+)